MAETDVEVTDVDYFEAKLLHAAVDFQQNFYEICSDWNLYKKDEHDYLRDFIGYALLGPPSYNEDDNENNERFNHFVYPEKEQAAINLVFEKVIKYGTNEQSDGELLCGIIYNVIFNKVEAVKASTEVSKASETSDETKKEDGTSKVIEREPQAYPVPVFKVRNGKKDKNVEEIYFIDNGGRVYHGFANYLANNTLPPCTMVLPKDGRYQGNPQYSYSKYVTSQSAEKVTTIVWMEVHESPASKTAAKVLIGGDIASTVVTVASMGIGLAAMVTPIGPGIVLASAVGAGVSGLWTVGRCAHQLADRGQHGESISVTDKEALGAWIGIAGGAMGLAATGGTVLLTRAVRTGATVGRAATIAYDAVQIGNLIVNGVGVGFKSYDIYAAYTEGGMEKVSAKDVFFLIAHVFFFCNSVINIRFAQNMIESTQGQMLKDYEASLRSNRHRKEFQRMARNTRALGTSEVSSNEEIIRGINKIDNKDEFFQAMVRNRKAFSAAGAKASFSSSGKVTVNGVMTIDPIEFANLPKDVRVDIAKGVGNVQLSNTPSLKPSVSVNVNNNNKAAIKNFTADNSNVLKEFCLKHSSAMLQSAPANIADFANVLQDLRNVRNRTEIFLKLLEIGYKILQSMSRNEDSTVGDTLASVVQFLWDYVKMNLKQMRPTMEIEDPTTQALLNELIRFLARRVEAKVEEWVEAFVQWLRKQFPQLLNEPFFQRHKSE